MATNQASVPQQNGHSRGYTAQNNRLLIEAVLYHYRVGIPWRDLPQCLGDFRVTHTRHIRWSKQGVRQQVFEVRIAVADNNYVQIEGAIFGGYQHSDGTKNDPAEECVVRSSGGLTTKIHATCETLGNPTGFRQSPQVKPMTRSVRTCYWKPFWIKSCQAGRQSRCCKNKTPRSLGAAPSGSSDSTEVQSKRTLGVRTRQGSLVTPD